MREKLIKRIVELSKEVDDDDMEYVNWNLHSNNELLEMFKRLVEVKVIMEHQDDASSTQQKHS